MGPHLPITPAEAWDRISRRVSYQMAAAGPATIHAYGRGPMREEYEWTAEQTHRFLRASVLCAWVRHGADHDLAVVSSHAAEPLVPVVLYFNVPRPREVDEALRRLAGEGGG